MDMTVVLITDATLMPDTSISVVPLDTEDDKSTVQNILGDLQTELYSNNKAEVEKQYVNSFITEVQVQSPPDDFKLNLYMKPNIDIVSKYEPLYLLFSRIIF